VDAARLNRSLWLEDAGARYPQLEGTVDVDVAVIGAGITGVTAACLLKAEGKKVALLESSAVGHGATGYTTAKLTVGHRLVYADLIDSFGVETARAYARSNQLAIERVLALVQEHGLDCDLEPASNYVYTESAESVAEIERETRAARDAGLTAELTTETDLPYPVLAAVRVDDQAQFHPYKYLAGLAQVVAGDGSHVFESTRATGVRNGDPCIVEAPTGSVRAGHVIVATQLPFLDRALYFAKAHPMTSYAIGAPVESARAPRGMYISIDEPTRSVRSTPADDGTRVLIVGGEGHKPGAEPNPHERYRRLERFLQERFGVERAEYHWSTHDYVPLDRLPYIGRLSSGNERVLVATGYAKWGMTKGTLAAEILRDHVLGRANEFAGLYDSTRLDLKRSAPKFATENGKVALRFFADRARPRPGRDAIEKLAVGDGTIVRIGTKQYAVYRDDDGVHALSARCTHLGCIVAWNRADRAWECPCHGSRFAADGTLVQGPATADLEQRELPDAD
jgi:glycine/D-amino acid oxidase-like deaminating enzyme/nitrite reductase/ring-hydroxylating ferredoxin subunit